MRFRAFRAFYLARTSIDLAAHHAEFFGIRGSAAMHKLSCVAPNRHLVRAGAVGGAFSSYSAASQSAPSSSDCRVGGPGVGKPLFCTASNCDRLMSVI